jgi:hypothetical protein
VRDRETLPHLGLGPIDKDQGPAARAMQANDQTIACAWDVVFLKISETLQNVTDGDRWRQVVAPYNLGSYALASI